MRVFYRAPEIYLLTNLHFEEILNFLHVEEVPALVVLAVHPCL